MSDDFSENYPTWLESLLFQGNLPWNHARNYSIKEFREKYTLHDSLWFAASHDIAFENSLILAIVLDTFWQPEKLKSSLPDLVILFVKLEDVQEVSFSGYKDNGRIQRGIGKDEFSEVDGKQIWKIDDHYGGSVSIVFSGKTWFLAIDGDKRVLEI
jgi:hypothetical protein